VSCAEIAEPIDLPFGLWTRVGWRKHKFNHICQSMCPHAWAHWRHLANTIEPSVGFGLASVVRNFMRPVDRGRRQSCRSYQNYIPIKY